MTRLDDKLARIGAGVEKRTDFIIADAKDPDMGPGLHAVGPARQPEGSAPRFRTREEFLQGIEAVISQDVVDIMLTSVSNLEKLIARKAFARSNVKPAIRANDTTDIWRHRGATYHHDASRAFRTASLARVKPLTDLGLYSITFTNDLDADLASLEAFRAFREDAAMHGFSYFLEVFNPNVDANLDPESVPSFVNDAIVRCLAGLTEDERPKFLKIAYNGPKALEELASYDPGLVVGVLGGGAGTTRDCFELIHQAQKYGARVALFGRKINLAESPLDIVRLMRAVSDGALTPSEAVEDYHDALNRKGLKPLRNFIDDREITEAVLLHG
jgi:DhnA family fructose-bisphosphate aldolase class Ia